MAHRNVPGVFIDYMEAGSYSEQTRDANVDDMRAIKLRQRVLVDVSQRNLKTTVLGEELAMPLALYGTLATLPVFVLWVYFSCVVTLGAALVAAHLGRGTGARGRTSGSGARARLARARV